MQRRLARVVSGLLFPLVRPFLLPLLLLAGTAGVARAQADAAATPADSASAAPLVPISGLTLRALRAEPERYQGQVIRWSGQFLSLQQADDLRTDLQAGEFYMLARESAGEPGYAYIAVPAHLLPVVRQLVPVERIAILGRVRTGRAPLMGYPVLELVELHP